ncbi:MAG TPA: membrane dipeptidase [Byssovorax sp.]|jgi:microsomal dipeptidase-like Zn-dependent dipeptidase
MADPPFVVDLHAHYPMQFDPEVRSVHAALRTARRRRKGKRHHEESLGDHVRFFVLEIADRFFNRASPEGGHAVTLASLKQGNVGVALSAAYCPFDEIDVEAPPGTPPRDEYFHSVHRLLRVVEATATPSSGARFVKSYAELEAARAAGELAMIHAVEGGFHVGVTPEKIAEHVAKLAEMGCGYVTVAHLLWRRVATNTAALPFLPDAVYHALFPQPADVGLEPTGRVLVKEMVRRGVLVDLTHMSERGMDETLAYLDKLDPARAVPVFASHIACRFDGGYGYNVREPYVKRIAERGGVCGVIYCDHFVNAPRAKPTTSFDATFDLVRRQIDELVKWGGEDVLAIGSDLDGFIKPTLFGLESAANHRDLAARIEATYGRAFAEKICHANALRMLKKGWMKPVAVP